MNSSHFIPLSFHLRSFALQYCRIAFRISFGEPLLYCKQLSNIRHANLHLCSSIAFFCNICIEVEQRCWFSLLYASSFTDKAFFLATLTPSFVCLIVTVLSASLMTADSMLSYVMRFPSSWSASITSSSSTSIW